LDAFNKKECEKCGSELYQPEVLKPFCMSCLAREIEDRIRENVKGHREFCERETRPTLSFTGADLAKAKAGARKVGKPYQAMSKDAIHQALS
jgi:predicted DNA binding CopG/RHH family protein